MSTRRREAAARRGFATVLAGAVLLTPFTLGAARAPESQPAAFCLPLLFSCPTPAPSTPAPGSPAPGLTPSLPALPLPGTSALPGAPATPAPSSTPGTATPTTAGSPSPSQPSPTAPVAAQREPGELILTKTPASMGSKNLSFSGLSSIGIVDVPTADGSTVRALKITADSITITGFSLTVRPPQGPGLVTTADTMTLQGHVSVYLGSITATSSNGKSLTVGTDTPPPLDDVKPGLLRVTMGLLGTTADSIHYTNTDQRIVQS